MVGTPQADPAGLSVPSLISTFTSAHKEEIFCHGDSLGTLPQMPQPEPGLLIEAWHRDGVQERR